jgi:hypothetical protein
MDFTCKREEKERGKKYTFSPLPLFSLEPREVYLDTQNKKKEKQNSVKLIRGESRGETGETGETGDRGERGDRRERGERGERVGMDPFSIPTLDFQHSQTLLECQSGWFVIG